MICRNCRYPLHGLDACRCPECGTAFDPSDPTTFFTPDPPIDWLGSMATLVRAYVWFAAILFVLDIVTSITLIAWHPIGGPHHWILCAAPFTPLIIAAIAFSLFPQVPIRLRTRVLTILLSLLLIISARTHWPLRLTFALHRPALERLAQRAAVPGGMQSPEWVGIYRLRPVVVWPEGELRFQVSGDSGGGIYLVFAKQPPQQDWYNTNWTIDLGDHWYLIEED